MNNAITTISPYKRNGTWMFDDERVGLAGEPFVAGADVMLDQLTKDIPHAQQGFTLLFSAGPFPGYTVKLEWTHEEYGGNWYRWAEAELEGWLCPALFHYFPEAPKEIYIRAIA